MSTNPAPTTTQAWIYSRTGPYRQTLTLNTAHPLAPWPPEPPFTSTAPQPEEWLLIRVAYAAFNPADAVALASMPMFLHKTKTAVPCLDLTGEVLDVWSPTSTPASPPQFKKSDKIIGFPPLGHLLATGTGGLQKIIALPAKYCVPLPASVLSLRDAAGLFLTACTAEIQVSDADLQPGQRVLVVGASGGVGTMAVQLARDKVGKDGYLVAICSGRNREMVLSLGADEVIDYTLHPGSALPAHLAQRFGSQPFDHVLDAYGHQILYTSCSSFLSEQGIYSAAAIHYDSYRLRDLLRSVLTIVGNILWPRTKWLGGTGRTWKIASLMDPSREQMERIAKMLGDGKLKVAIDSEWGWDAVHEALDVLCSGHAAGKVIVRVKEDGDADGE